VVVLKNEADGVEAKISQLILAQAPDIFALDTHAASVRSQDARDHAQKRGLPAARWAHDEDHLAKVRNKADRVYRRHVRCALAKVLRQPDSNDRFAFGRAGTFVGRVLQVHGSISGRTVFAYLKLVVSVP